VPGFGADPTIIGHIVRISGQPFEVIGVAPASFEGAGGGVPGTKLWIPLAAEASLSPPTSTAPRDRRRLLVFGRLAPAVTVSSASAELRAIAARLDTAFPPRARGSQAGPTERPWRAKSIVTITEEDSILRRFGLTLVALVALVLVVACTNLANLVLARGTNKQQEFAIRRALGASRWRLVRAQCVESLILAIAGAIASYAVFEWLQVLMNVEFNLTLPTGGRWTLAVRPALDATALWIAAGSMLISLVVFGLEPALQLTRARDVSGALAAAGALGHPRARRQRTLLRWQVAISAGFFIIATMFVKHTIEEARHDSGIDMDRLGIAVLNFDTQQWDEARARRTLDRVLQEARTDPAIVHDAVSVSTGMPFGVGSGVRLALAIPDKTGTGKDDYHRATGIAATPSIFRTIGVPILRGRGFDDRDHSRAVPAVVLSEFTALKIFGTADVVGRQLVLQFQPSHAPLATVIGVARDTDIGHVLGETRSFVYLPIAQRYEPLVAVVARSSGDAASAVRALRQALRRADPDLAIDVIGTGREILSGPFMFLRAAGLAALALGALTLLLAMVGLFGVQSHIVARRTREIGVRMSLGASAVQIKRMVLTDGCSPVVEGLALGLFIGLAGRAVVRAYLDIEVSVVDPWMLLTVPIPLIVAAFCACYLPAHRAAAVDPGVALRHL
jgi:predicted permease